MPRSWFWGFRWKQEFVLCNLCSSDDYATLFETDAHALGLRTVICRRCGLVYLNPRPSADDYRSFYLRYSHRFYPQRAASGKGEHEKRTAEAVARRRIESYRSYLREGFRLLEVGPGEGAFLAEAGQRGGASEIIGIDPSPAEVEACRRRGLDVRLGYIDSVPQELSGFTHVAAFHVLEHTLDPLGLLKRLMSRLKPGGLLLVEVPNILGSWRGLGMLHIAHPYSFKPSTLRFALEKAGFNVLTLEPLEEALFESSLRAVAQRSDGSKNDLCSSPEPAVAEAMQLFRERLKHWRRDQLVFLAKKSVLRIAGPSLGYRIYDKIASFRQNCGRM